MPGLSELPQSLLENVLSSLSLPDLVQLALTCKVLQARVAAAAPEIWQRTFATHLPWHPVIGLGRDAARDALVIDATCSDNIAASKDWDKDLEAHPSDTCLSEGGKWLAGVHSMSEVVIRPLHTGQDKMVRHSLTQILSISWHPDDEHISVLSIAKNADPHTCRSQFAVYNVQSGACAMTFKPTCMALLEISIVSGPLQVC